MKKGRIYISGPISGLDVEKVRERFKKVQLMLEDDGWVVFNPKENGLEEDSPTARHMRRDLVELSREDNPCIAIYMMEGWNHSAGCWTEFHDALAMGMYVIFEQIGYPIKFK